MGSRIRDNRERENRNFVNQRKSVSPITEKQTESLLYLNEIGRMSTRCGELGRRDELNRMERGDKDGAERAAMGRRIGMGREGDALGPETPFF